MSDYRYFYNDEKKHHVIAKDRDKPRKHRGSHNVKEASHRTDITSNRSITPEDPTRLSSSERKQLLELRIMELEENQRTINNIQNEIIKDKLKSPHVEYAKHHNPSKYEMYVQPYKDKSTRHFYPSYIQTSIPENDTVPVNYSQYKYISGERTKDVRNIRKAGRTRRASILDKAEELIKSRQRKEFLPNNTNRRRKKHLTYVVKGTRSSSSDEEFVEVPEHLDSDTSSDNDVRQPRVKSWKSRSDVPSVVQVISHHSCFNFIESTGALWF